MKKIDNTIGIGIYTLQEASLYSQISPQKLSRWVFGTASFFPVVEAQLANNRLISFYDLVQAMAIDRARSERISLPKIKNAIDYAKERYGVQFPLAHNHDLIYFDGELHIEFPDKKAIQVSGKGKNQILMRKIIEPFKMNLHFGDDGLVTKFVPLKYNNKQIVLDPTRQFGHPLVNGTGYRADVLAEAYETEMSENLVADLFNISVEDVKIAVKYIKGLKEAA